MAFEETLAEVELLIPYTQGARLHELHEVAGSLERTDRDDGVLVQAKVPVAELHRFDDLAAARGSVPDRSLRARFTFSAPVRRPPVRAAG